MVRVRPSAALACVLALACALPAGAAPLAPLDAAAPPLAARLAGLLKDPAGTPLANAMATADAALAAGAIGAPEATAGLVAPERGNLADARRAIDAMTEDRGPDLTMVPKSSSAFLGAQIDLPAP